MTRVTPTEAVAALTMLAAHQVDVAQVHRALGCTPEITRRPQEVCPLGNHRECRLFGVTWWPSAGTFAGYVICLAHEWVDGPTGPLSQRLPLPHRMPSPDEQVHAGRGLVLVPHADIIAWAVAQSGSTLAEGDKRVNTAGSEVLDDVAVWLRQLLQSFRPEAVMISGKSGMEAPESEHKRLPSIGIEVRTRDLGTAVDGYRGLMRLERVIGVLHGVASVYCPQRVYLAPTLQPPGAAPLGQREPDDQDMAATLSLAASAAAELIHQRERSGEG